MYMPLNRPLSLAGVAGVLTLGAGLVHATAAGSHAGDTTLVALFAVTAVVQAVLGAALLARPDRRTLVAAAAVNLVVAGGWLVSRTTGIPVIDGLAHVEAVGLQDLMATVLEVAAGVAALVAVRNPDRLPMSTFSPLLALVLAPALVGMVAPHNGNHGHEAGGHGHEAGGHGHAPSSLATDPVFSGGETAHATEAELKTAKKLIEGTRKTVAALFPDEAAVKAAGYTSIGDGFPISSFEHYINPAYLEDGRELDPDRIESIVIESTPAGEQVASAMFILETGKTMADVTNLTYGGLASYHDHQNLCWDESGTRIAGFLLNGNCMPRGEFKPTPPMLHVWMKAHECGPFSGLEGHGASCAAHLH
jgi:hypothetical protein